MRGATTILAMVLASAWIPLQRAASQARGTGAAAARDLPLSFAPSHGAGVWPGLRRVCSPHEPTRLPASQRIARPGGLGGPPFSWGSQPLSFLRLQQGAAGMGLLVKMAADYRQVAAPSERVDVPDFELGERAGCVVLRVLQEGGNAVPSPGPEGGMRLSEALQRLDSERYPSKKQAKKAIKHGSIVVNGQRGTHDTVVFPSSRVTVQGRSSAAFGMAAWRDGGNLPFTIDVLYQDDCMAAVHKPPGVNSHPPSNAVGSESFTSMSVAVPYFVAPAKGYGTDSNPWRPGPVHRLDKATEGVQLIAKTRHARRALMLQFQERQVAKRYVAVVEGRVRQLEGEIDIDIGDKPSSTRYRVLGTTPSASSRTDSCLTTLELFPKQGRTHQLRIHCKEHFGMPIIGDRRYGGLDLGCGLLLAAVDITVAHPETRELMTFSIEEPERFLGTKKRERLAWEREDEGVGSGGGPWH